MAFHPIHSFVKYKRVWMALVMILTMLTFVVCTGVQGDLSDRLLRLFGRRGTVIGSLDGSNLYREDIDKLKLQRTVVNDCMRTFSTQMVEKINDKLKGLQERNPDKEDENSKKQLTQLSQVRQMATIRLKDKYFFDTGVKADELIDFRTWLAEADRLGISLLPQHLEILVATELHRPDFREAVQSAQEDFQVENQALIKVRENHGGAGINILTVLAKGLEDEYRVRVAKLGAAEYQLRTALSNFPKRIKPGASLPAVIVRDPISPGHLWDYYQDYRQEIDIALLPIPVQNFVRDVGTPDNAALQ